MKQYTVKLKSNTTGADSALITELKGVDSGLNHYQLFKSGKSMGSFIGSISQSLIVKK